MKDGAKTVWKIKPIPKRRKDFGYDNFFYDVDAEKLLAGFMPKNRDDKWFIYSANGWVYFVRSRTGFHIFGLKLWPTPAGGSRVVESWYNANTNEYRSPRKEENTKLINVLLEKLFQIDQTK